MNCSQMSLSYNMIRRCEHVLKLWSTGCTVPYSTKLIKWTRRKNKTAYYACLPIKIFFCTGLVKNRNIKLFRMTLLSTPPLVPPKLLNCAHFIFHSVPLFITLCSTCDETATRPSSLEQESQTLKWNVCHLNAVSNQHMSTIIFQAILSFLSGPTCFFLLFPMWWLYPPGNYSVLLIKIINERERQSIHLLSDFCTGLHNSGCGSVLLYFHKPQK